MSIPPTPTPILYFLCLYSLISNTAIPSSNLCNSFYVYINIKNPAFLNPAFFSASEEHASSPSLNMIGQDWGYRVLIGSFSCLSNSKWSRSTSWIRKTESSGAVSFSCLCFFYASAFRLIVSTACILWFLCSSLS